MRRLALVLAAAALIASACGSGSSAGGHGLSSAAFRALPQSLRAFIRSTLAKPNNGPTREIDVYGPGTHRALEQAASEDIVYDPETKKDFYLIVQRGKFVCHGCSSPGPTGANSQRKPPSGTIETSVWSAESDASDWGIQSRLPAAVSRLHPIAVIRLS